MSVPKLRFKEFDGDWSIKSLSELANLTSSKRVHLADYVPDGIPFFRGKEITELKSGVFPSDILYISHNQFNEFKEKYGAPKNNEILITAVGTLANTYLVNTNYDFYFKDGNLIWLKDIKADPKFMMILLDSKKNDVLASAIGSTQKALTIANLNKLIFNFPCNLEQTQIAFFLSAVDEKINQLTQKHKLLSQYKQGMMQKLFSQQIRFEAGDGSEFGEWELLTIQDLVDREVIEKPMDGNHGEIHPTSKDYVNEGIPFIMATDVINGKVHLQNSKKITKQQADSLRKGFSIAGDILLTHKATIGNIAIVPSLEVEYIMLTPQVTYYRVINSKKLSNQFLKVYFEAPQFQKSLLDLCTGATRLYIGISEQRKLPIYLPSLEEQTKIANFLSSIDQKIEVVAQQIEHAKQWKKGLLQQMFV
ncbi:restriction endonuclease subunit S [Acinetobacter haemolyticus]|uniref:restriction endonuclease subunit S n=1 Tax=Acinetobacter haemolyticus TaxID=29430 RepID=UPI000DE9A675|nr:restriction endonuclease subunit S [Acinetobacter haemolyticus]WHR58353.1 restriction endonuclease subunit S [Acinetobacter haemolyticus]